MNENYTLAVEAYLKQDFAQTIKYCRMVIENDPLNYDALNLLGASLNQTGELKEAETLLLKAIELKPEVFKAFFNLGECYFYQDKLSEAEKNYKIVLELNPDFADAYNRLSEIYTIQNSAYKKLSILEKQTIRFKSDDATALYNLALEFDNQNNLPKAKEYYYKAIENNPGYLEAMMNLGVLLGKENNRNEALKFYLKAYELKKDIPNLTYNLGLTYYHLKKYYEAEKFFLITVQLDNDFYEAYSFLNYIYYEQKKINQAIEALKNCLRLSSENPTLHFNLGQLYHEIGEEQKSFSYIKESAKFDNSKLTNFYADICWPIISKDNQEIDFYTQRMENAINTIDLKPEDINLNKNLFFNGFPAEVMYQIQGEHHLKRRFASIFERALEDKVSKYYLNKLTKSNKPKIGIVVTKDHEGVFMTCMSGILNNFPPDHFDIYIINNNPEYYVKFAPFINNKNIKYLPLKGSIEESIKVIYNHQFDLLYYWEISTDLLNFILPLFRLAKVQCTSYGWPVSSGIKNIDYFISSEHLEIPGSERFYSEKLYKLKSLPSYYFPKEYDSIPKPRDYFNLPIDKNIYLCVQNILKIVPEFDLMINDILLQDKNGLVVFMRRKNKPSTYIFEDRIKTVCHKVKDRIIFLNELPDKTDYLNLISIVDVVLDTTNFSGANTAYDCFAVGTPIITFPSPYNKSRYTSGLYQQMQIDNMICSSREEYISRAIEIANNLSERKKISDRIKSSTHSIFKSKKAIDELFGFFKNVI